MTRNFGGRAKGAVGEFEWRPRPDSDQTSGGGSSSGAAGDAAATGAAAAAAAAASGVAFKPAAFPHKGPMATFNKFPGGACWAWHLLQVVLAHPPPSRGLQHSALLLLLVAHPPEPHACTTMCAEYLHDPEAIKAERRRQQLQKERELLAARSGAWRPGGQVKSDATRSIVRMNL